MVGKSGSLDLEGQPDSQEEGGQCSLTDSDQPDYLVGDRSQCYPWTQISLRSATQSNVVLLSKEPDALPVLVLSVRDTNQRAGTCVRERALQRVEIRQHMDAVDAAVSEEVKDDHFPTHVSVNRQRLFCIQPF